MRSKNSFLNSVTAMIGKTLALITGFIVRVFFVKALGDTYLSVNTLFTNIISVLSIADLGFGTAICYAMYKPMANGDPEKTNQLLHFYKKVYRVIGLVIFGLGLVLLPFLKPIVGSENMIKDIYMIYMLFIVRACVTYWMFSYRTSIVDAAQKRYKIQRFEYLFDILSAVSQILMLILFNSFIGYMLVSIAFILIKNVFIGFYVAKMFPYIKIKPEGNLSKEEKKELYKNIYGVAFYRISGTIYTSSDSIIIAASSMIPFVAVGYYGNYHIVFAAIISIIGSVISSFTSSIGNFNILENKEKKLDLFGKINFLNFWIYGVLSVCLMCLIDPFVKLLFGAESVLSFWIVALLVLNFIMDGIGKTIIIYKDACGLFFKGRHRPMISALLNIVLSVVLIYPFGLAGVILGTILSRLLSTFWYDTILVYKNVFETSSKKYFIVYFLQLIFIVGISALMYYLMSFITISNLFMWCVWGVVLFIASNLIFLLCFAKTKSFKFLKDKFMLVLKTLFKRNRSEKVKDN